MDMDGPFFKSSWNQPSRRRYSPSFRGIPVTPVQRNVTVSSPKVVSIPVHFVGSETTRSAAALKIQKVFRGYMVRKSVKKIVCIKREVDEIERRISRGDAVDLIRKDAKERLKVNETLMSLLFKLDSIRGVDCAVRDCRKAVIKKAIALQERVDAIVAGDQDRGNNRESEVDDSDADALAEAVDPSMEIEDASERMLDSAHAEDQTIDIHGNATGPKDPNTVSIDNQTPEIENSIDNSIDSENSVPRILEMEGEAPVDEPVEDGSICAEEVHNDERGANVAESEAMVEAEDESPNLQLLSGTAMEIPADDVSMSCAEVSAETEEKTNKSFVVQNICAEAFVDAEGGANLDEPEAMPHEAKDEITTLQVSNGTAMENPAECISMDLAETGVETEEGETEVASIEKQVVEQDTTASQNDCVEESVETSATEVYSLNLPSFMQGGEENTSERDEDEMEVEQNKERAKELLGVEGRDDHKRSRELLEKMVEDNEKMMSLMNQLFERNEMQTKMLSSLSQRVEQLEKAYISDKIRRKKKRH